MLPCDEVHQLADEYVNDTLDAARRHDVSAHLHVCEPCHRFMDEARLAQRVLEETGPPPPPPSLADSIKHAGLMRLRYRPRPLHERALGSPAFLAVCASLLCGAIICLLAIMKVAAVPTWTDAPPPQVSVVARMVLPTREPGLRVRHVTAPQALREAVASVRPHAHAGAALMALPARPRPVAARPSALQVVAVRPQRALTPFVHVAPIFSLTPTLPEATIVPASARTSLPEGGPTSSRALMGGGEADASRLDLTDLAAPTAPRTDFTATH